MDTHTDAIIHHVSQPARIAVLTAVALLLVVLPTAAHAGTYNVTACNDAPGGANNSWVPFNTDTTHLQTRLSCPYTIDEGQQASQENGIATTDLLELPNGAQAGAQAGWKFEVPDPENEKITGISYDRMFSTQDQYWIPALRANGAILPGQTCKPPIAGSCLTGSGPGGPDHATLTGLSADTLTLGLECTAPTGQECITGADNFHAAVATMYSAEVTIQDNTPPTLNTPTGALWEPGAYAGFHKGTEGVTVSAHDLGGGVQSIVLAADGRPVEAYEASCDFTLAQPCPPSTGAQTLALPTTELADGTHTLTLIATDAAGNQSTIASEQLAVDNNPPPPPIGLTATATQAGGSTFTATWTDPEGQTAPITAATYQVCPTSGSRSCSAPEAAPPTGPTTVTVPGPGSRNLAVWLTNAAGNTSPASAAHVTLTVTPDESHGEASDSNSNGGGSVSSGNSGGDSSTVTKHTLHVIETLRHRTLTVRVTGPSNGTVRVSYIARYRGKVIAIHTKKATLRRGRLTVTFTLSTQATAHATIRVNAQFGGDPPATSTLHRPL